MKPKAWVTGHGKGWIQTLRPAVASQKFGLFVSVVAFFVYIAIMLPHWNEQGAGADGYYSWIFARSVAFDGDIEFTNDYQVCGDPWGLGARKDGAHHPGNPFYPGPLLFWVPILFVLRHVVHLPAASPLAVNMGCTGLLTAQTLQFAALFAAITIYLSYRAARRFASDGVSAFVAALFAVGSSLLAYSAVFVCYSHLYATLCMAATLLATLRAREIPTSLSRWGIVGLALACTTFQRPSDAIAVAVPLTCIAFSGLTRRGKAASATLVVAGVAIGIAATSAIYHYLYARWWLIPQGYHFLHLSHAHPLLALFSAQAGLLFVTPVAWTAVFGLGLMIRIRGERALASAIMLTIAAIVFISSAVLDWHGAGTYGARRLVVLTPVFILLGAVAVQHALNWLQARPARLPGLLAIAAVVSVGFTTIGSVMGMTRQEIPIIGSLSQAELYGQGNKTAWTLIDESLGDVAVLPATMYFGWRYRIPMNRWKEATNDRYCIRSHLTLAWEARGFSFTDPEIRKTTSGGTAEPTGFRLGEGLGRVVFTARWPFVTHLVLRATTSEPAEVRVGFGAFPHRVSWAGSAVFGVPGVPDHQSIAIPEGLFDSGINELVFEWVGGRDRDGGPVLIEVSFEDTKTR